MWYCRLLRRALYRKASDHQKIAKHRSFQLEASVRQKIAKNRSYQFDQRKQSGLKEAASQNAELKARGSKCAAPSGQLATKIRYFEKENF